MPSLPGRTPNAMPVFWTWVIERPGTTEWLSLSAIRSSMTRFVNWSATAAATATAAKPAHCNDPARWAGSGPTWT